MLHFYLIQGDEVIQKVKDITSAVHEELGDLCTCEITNDNIDEDFFQCFGASSHFVTYRARLSGTPNITSHILITYIEDWVSGGPSIRVQGVLLTVDNECPVSIATIDDAECKETPALPSLHSSTDNTVAVLATVIIIAVLVFVFAMTVLILVWRSRHGNPPVQKTVG